MRYDGHRNGLKGTVRTYFEDASVTARRTGLTIDTMTASVLSGSAISINSQSYSSSNESLAYQIRFSQAGVAVLQIVTTFVGSDETEVVNYRYTTIDNAGSAGDYR